MLVSCIKIKGLCLAKKVPCAQPHHVIILCLKWLLQAQGEAAATKKIADEVRTSLYF